MRCNDAPSLWKTRPYLALPAVDDSVTGFAFELKRDAAEITAEAHDINSFYSAHKI